MVDFRIYLITDSGLLPPDQFLERIRDLVEAGVGAVQMREKALSEPKQLELASSLRRITAPSGAKLIINGRPDIALAAGADGVHLPDVASSGSTFAEARSLGVDLIGQSTHSPASAIAAEEAGADFITFGPVYDTPSKRSFGPPAGLAALRNIARQVSLPVFALGGIRADRVAECLDAGAYGIAAIRDLLTAEDPRRKVEQYLKAISQNTHA